MLPQVAAVLTFFKGKTLLVSIILSLLSGSFAGYKFTSWYYANKELKAMKELEERRLEDERRIADLTKMYLEAKDKREVVYRDRIKKVVEYIDRDNCAVNDDGLRILNDALRGEDR